VRTRQLRRSRNRARTEVVTRQCVDLAHLVRIARVDVDVVGHRCSLRETTYADIFNTRNNDTTRTCFVSNTLLCASHTTHTSVATHQRPAQLTLPCETQVPSGKQQHPVRDNVTASASTPRPRRHAWLSVIAYRRPAALRGVHALVVGAREVGIVAQTRAGVSTRAACRTNDAARRDHALAAKCAHSTHQPGVQ
jgi:hypothetical protein